MKIEPDALLWHAKRAGLTLKRSPRDTLLVFGDMQEVPADWLTVLKQHKAALLPLLPLHQPKLIVNPAPPTPPPTVAYGLRRLPQQGNYDLFDGVTPYRGKTHKNQKTVHDLVQAVAPSMAGRQPARREPELDVA